MGAKKIQNQIEKIDFNQSGNVLSDTYKIRSTKNYEWFRLIDGNRDVRHASKIKKSIEAVGLLVCPILVNEKMEIIDGQGRFTACKELNLPVYYVQQKGIGIEEVRKMNSVSSNWTTGDYVHSYTEGEDISDAYIYLEGLYKQFPDFGYSFLASVASGFEHTKILKDVKNGNFACSQKEYERAVTKLTWLQKFVPFVTSIGGKSDYMYRALSFCFDNDQIDNNYLLVAMEKKYKGVEEVASIRGALEKIQTVYNATKDHDPAFIISDYDRYLMSIKKRSIKRS